MTRLTMEQVRYYLGNVPGWHLAENQVSLVRTVICDDFPSAIQLINQVATLLKQDDSHVEMRIAGNQVTFALSTKEANGLTGTDFALAQMINKIL